MILSDLTLAIDIVEFIDENGASPFSKWFNNLQSLAAAKVTTAIHRLSRGNFSNVKSVGGGVYEYKLTFGPGYRIYFGQDADRLVILLTGGTKQRQSDDIKQAKNYWQNYKQMKREAFLCH